MEFTGQSWMRISASRTSFLVNLRARALDLFHGGRSGISINLPRKTLRQMMVPPTLFQVRRGDNPPETYFLIMKTKPRVAVSVFASVAILFLVGCASVQQATTRDLWVATTLELTGTEGASFTGYYVVKGKKLHVSGVLPKSFTDFDVTRCEFLKRDVQDTLTLTAGDGRSHLNMTAFPGTVGVRANLARGWNVGTISK